MTVELMKELRAAAEAVMSTSIDGNKKPRLRDAIEATEAHLQHLEREIEALQSGPSRRLRPNIFLNEYPASEA